MFEAKIFGAWFYMKWSVGKILPVGLYGLLLPWNMTIVWIEANKEERSSPASSFKQVLWYPSRQLSIAHSLSPVLHSCFLMKLLSGIFLWSLLHWNDFIWSLLIGISLICIYKWCLFCFLESKWISLRKFLEWFIRHVEIWHLLWAMNKICPSN